MIKGIIFDKDGTLIDFDSFWITVSVNAIKSILRKLNSENIPIEEILLAIGVENNITDMDGLLCKGTYEQIALAINEVLKNYGCNIAEEEITDMVLDAYNLSADSGDIKPTCENIKEVLEELNKRGIKLAVVTTDNSEITRKCLKQLEIEDLFYKIYTDDGKTPVKPDPYCVFNFAEITEISKDEILMVGDTMTDVNFARNAGIKVLGVGATTEKRGRLRPYVDFVAPDMSYIFKCLEEDN